MKNRPSVLQVGKYYPPHMGGIETHLEALSQSLAPVVDLKVVVCADGRETISERVDGIDVTRAGSLCQFASTSICPGMARVLRRSDADLIHLHLPNPMAALAYLASGHRGKVIVTYHSDTVKQKVLGALFQPILDLLLRRASAIIVTSQKYLESSRTLRPYRSKCHVIPYGIDTARVRQCDPAKRDAIRARFGDQMILAVGRLVYYKGFQYLIEAMAHCPGHLVLVGDGPLRAELESLAEARGVKDRVTFLGELNNEETFPYYHAAAVFCLPSVARSEAFGIVQIEAMAAGTPVVNTSLESGVPFISLHNVTGLTVPPRDVPALAAALTELLANEEKRALFGRQAVERAETEFNIASMRYRTLDLYRRTHKDSAWNTAISDGRPRRDEVSLPERERSTAAV
jgi:glycosyltransferase involved in cell wall biosynthesis